LDNTGSRSLEDGDILLRSDGVWASLGNTVSGMLKPSSLQPLGEISGNSIIEAALEIDFN